MRKKCRVCKGRGYYEVPCIHCLGTGKDKELERQTSVKKYIKNKLERRNNSNLAREVRESENK